MNKTKLYHILEKGSYGSRYNLWFDYFIMSLIVLNVIALIFDSIAGLPSTLRHYIEIFEIVSVVIFTIEYLLRIYIADLHYDKLSRPKAIMAFVLSFYGIIDLLAILPFYLPFFVMVDLRFLRLMRLLRFLRILKLNRYSNALRHIGAVVHEKRSELITTGFLASLVLLMASFMMYYAEGEVQPEAFPNVLASIWWAVATLTTVGYGDVYPITATGKLISGVIAILGIGLVALPTGIIGSGFMAKMNYKEGKKKCPHCGKEIDEE